MEFSALLGCQMVTHIATIKGTLRISHSLLHVYVCLERERHTDTERHRHRERETERGRDRDRQREGERERERDFFGITLTAKWSRLSEKIWQVRPFPVVLLHLSCIILKNHVPRPLCFTKIYTAPKLIWHCFKNKAKASQNIRDIRKLTLNV